jgi:hypothetical protein
MSEDYDYDFDARDTRREYEQERIQRHGTSK